MICRGFAWLSISFNTKINVSYLVTALANTLCQVEITKLKMDKDRRKILERKARPKLAEKEKGMGKHKEKDVQSMDTS